MGGRELCGGSSADDRTSATECCSCCCSWDAYRLCGTSSASRKAAAPKETAQAGGEGNPGSALRTRPRARRADAASRRDARSRLALRARPALHRAVTVFAEPQRGTGSGGAGGRRSGQTGPHRCRKTGHQATILGVARLEAPGDFGEHTAQHGFDGVELGLTADQRRSQLDDGVAAIVGAAIQPGLEQCRGHLAEQR